MVLLVGLSQGVLAVVVLGAAQRDTSVSAPACVKSGGAGGC